MRRLRVRITEEVLVSLLLLPTERIPDLEIILTKANGLSLHPLHDQDQLLPTLLDLFLLDVVHIVYCFHDMMYVSPPRLNAHTIRPANVKMTDRTPVVLANIEKPVKDIVVILCVETDLVDAIKDGSCFVVDRATCSEESRICRL